MKRTRYTDDYRASAVLLLEGAGWPNRKGALHEVAGKLGIYDATLARWARRQQNPPPNELVNEKRLEVRDIVAALFNGFSTELLARVENGDLIDEPLNVLMSGWGISFDKGQLLDGKPTERHATVYEELAQIPADERQAVLDEAQEILNDARRNGHR